MIFTRTILTIVCTVLAGHVLGGGNQNAAIAKSKQWFFIENKGQLHKPEIKYYGQQGGVYLYCYQGAIGFAFSKINENYNEQISEATGTFSKRALHHGHSEESPDPTIFKAAGQSKIIADRADLVLLNSNPNAQIIASGLQEYYENFYTNGNTSQGVTHVHAYKTIRYKLIYDNIDMILFAREGGMKYEFVVYPGGKVSNIQMQWRGIQGIEKFQNYKIEYSMALGKMDEDKPISFQGHKQIESDFLISGNKVGFKVNKYDKRKVLVIDPTLIWGTYFGQEGSTGSGIKNDLSGNLYITGYTSSISGIALNSSYQGIYGGGINDAFVSKFTDDGHPLWSTYYGGNGDDEGFGIDLDGKSNIYITGVTTSLSNIASANAYQKNFGGVQDAFITKFNQDGIMKWGSYYGGENQDVGYGIVCGSNGYVFITGTTKSKNGIASPGAFQSFLPDNGNFNAFIAAFDTGTGNRAWATYFGNSLTSASGIAADHYGNIYVTGSTFSDSGIATAGTYQTSYQGNGDVYVTKFTEQGKMQWGTYIGGPEIEYSNGVYSDNNGSIYFFLSTSSGFGLATLGAYIDSLGPTTSSAGYPLLVKFNDNGTLAWSTYYTGNIRGMTGDGKGNLYLTGFTSTSVLATKGAYQPFMAGGTDAFISSFNKNGNIRWATLYGGTGIDYGYGISLDTSENIYITGYTQSPNGIATKNAYQVTNFGNSVAFIAKFGYPVYDAGIDSFVSPTGNGCMDTLPLVIRLKNYGIATLDSVTIFFSINGKPQSPYFWKGKLPTDSTAAVNLGNFIFSKGSNILKSWTYNPNDVLDSFPANDTSVTTISINPLPIANAGPDTTLCYDETYTMQGSGGTTYTWRPATYLSSSADPKATAVLPNTEQYVLVVSNGIGCTDSGSVVLKVRPKLKVKALANNNSVCYEQYVILSAKASGGDSLHYQYLWVNDSLPGDSIAKNIYKSGWHKIKLTDNCTPVPAIDSLYISVLPRPKASFTWSPKQNVIQKHQVSFIDQSSNASNYLWLFGSTDSSRLTSPDYIYKDTGVYKIMLIAFGLNNCESDTAYGIINIISDQVNIYIPNAFSPNNDGINDFFDISGVGIKSYSYNIYNRWGENIFCGTGRWDGNFKEGQVPEGIYIYTVDVTDIDGIHHFLRGNVTVMR